jgi:hypothetical protein
MTTRDGLTRACALAAQASRQRWAMYAVHKLHLSYRSCSTNLMDLQPSPYKVHSVEKDPLAHVYLANAITSAYSAIEDLHLQVIVPSGKSSREPDGSWNPDIKADLERRLHRSHVDLSVPHIWVLRGPPTRIERRRQPKGVGKPAWSRGPVRDIELEVIDALAMASWLRSKVSAHGLSKEARSLTAFDAYNVQSLARRLILEKFRLITPSRRVHQRSRPRRAISAMPASTTSST